MNDARLGWAACACAVLFATAARGDDGIPVATMTELKAATVFVRTTAGRFARSGSGFVFRVDGDQALVATNHHVIAPPEDAPRGLRPRVALVFNSGAPEEWSAVADVLASDAARDLAVLRVRAEPGRALPRPVDASANPELVETMPIYTFGFPFGDALATGKGSPAITVGRGSVSSLRRDDRGRTALVQIDGALNPGNSGGPVVDAQGRLIGIAVATIRGAQHIGLAIPHEQLDLLLAGRVGESSLRLRKREGTSVALDVAVDLIDPLEKIRAVRMLYVAGTVLGVAADADGSFGSIAARQPATRSATFDVKDRRALGPLVFDLPRATERKITFQIEYVDGRGATRRTRPAGFDLSSASRPIAVRGDTPRAGLLGSSGSNTPGAPIAAAPTLGIAPFVAVAVDPGHKVAFTTDAAGNLLHYGYPAFDLKATYKLDGAAYRAEIDGDRGLLFLVVTPLDQLDFPNPSETPRGRADLHVYDVKAIQNGTADPAASTTPLKPAAVVKLGAGVTRMFISGDARRLFLLTHADGLRGPAKLLRVDTTKNAADIELDLPEGTESMCLTPGGKMLYTATSPAGHDNPPGQPAEGLVQQVDPMTLEVLRAAAIPLDPFDVQAADSGLILVSGTGGGQSKLAIVDLKRKTPVLAEWSGIAGAANIRLLPDQKRLIVGSHAFTVLAYVSNNNGRTITRMKRTANVDNVSLWMLPPKLSFGPHVMTTFLASPEFPLDGEVFVTPDGKFALNRYGAALVVIPTGKDAATLRPLRPGSSSQPAGNATPAPARPRKLN